MQGEIKVVAGSSHPELAKSICAHLGLSVARSRVVRFANENLMVQIDENVREADVFVIQTSCTPVSDGILELLITLDALRHASAAR
jgi:ribose-phosphate pyrophosphokinase